MTDDSNIYQELIPSVVNTVECVEDALIYCKVPVDLQYSPLKIKCIQRQNTDLVAYYSFN